MGSADIIMETPQGPVMFDVKTIEVQSLMRSLRTVSDFNPRFPRKFKKKLKKHFGRNYSAWLKSPMKWVVNDKNLDIYSYHNVDAEKELTELLKNETNHDTNEES